MPKYNSRRRCIKMHWSNFPTHELLHSEQNYKFKTQNRKTRTNQTCNSIGCQDTRCKQNSKSKLQEYGVSEQLLMTFKEDRKTDYQIVHPKAVRSSQDKIHSTLKCLG